MPKNNTKNNLRILAKVGCPAALEGLAEECAELTKAALKLARILRGENPSPVPYEEALKSIMEEVADVNCYVDILSSVFPIGGKEMQKATAEKRKRFLKRLEDAKRHLQRLF